MSKVFAVIRNQLPRTHAKVLGSTCVLAQFS